MCNLSDTSQQQDADKHPDINKHKQSLQRGFYWGAASLAFWLVATNMSMPYTQDKRNSLACDSMCQGSMNSARSTLSLLGAAAVGRLSDAPFWDVYRVGGRRLCLLLGVAATATSLVLTSRAASLTALWQSLVPAVLQQNFSIVKALFSDYHAQLESSSTQRASTAGMLGMVGGLAMMLGPLIGSFLLEDIHQATTVSLVALLLAALCIVFVPLVPSSKRTTRHPAASKQHSRKENHAFWSMLDVPSARSPPALFLLACRLLTTLAFHIFATISAPSLKRRFDFGPPEYGKFFSFVGFCYAMSQYMAPWFLRGGNGSANHHGYRKHVFVAALATIGVGRSLALSTDNVYAMYAYYAVSVLATGIVSTIFSTDTSQVAAPGEAGAFFGVVASIESGAGMVGPLVGGALATTNDQNDTTAPLVASSSLIALMGAIVWLGYEPIVLTRLSKKKAD